MTTMPPLRDILNDTPANAVDVDYNFGLIESHIANELINRDGSVAMTGALTTQPPTAPGHAATKAYVDAYTPVGLVAMWSTAVAPTGWAICDGASKSTTDPAYAALFAVIGYTYGGAGGNFNLPNLKGRFPVGRDAAVAPHDTLGEVGGTRDTVVASHNHTQDTHQHATNAHQHSGNTGTVSADHTHGFSGTTTGAGGHDHQTYVGSDLGWFQFGGGSLGPKSPGDFTQGWNVSQPTRTSSVGDHTHNYSGNTGGISANHFHGFTTNNDGASATDFRTPTIQSAGVSGVNQNLPPYLTLNFIIRIG